MNILLLLLATTLFLIVFPQTEDLSTKSGWYIPAWLLTIGSGSLAVYLMLTLAI